MSPLGVACDDVERFGVVAPREADASRRGQGRNECNRMLTSDAQWEYDIYGLELILYRKEGLRKGKKLERQINIETGMRRGRRKQGGYCSERYSVSPGPVQVDAKRRKLRGLSRVRPASVDPLQTNANIAVCCTRRDGFGY